MDLVNEASLHNIDVFFIIDRRIKILEHKASFNSRFNSAGRCIQADGFARATKGLLENRFKGHQTIQIIGNMEDVGLDRV